MPPPSPSQPTFLSVSPIGISAFSARRSHRQKRLVITCGLTRIKQKRLLGAVTRNETLARDMLSQCAPEDGRKAFTSEAWPAVTSSSGRWRQSLMSSSCFENHNAASLNHCGFSTFEKVLRRMHGCIRLSHGS
jgi:hypothetical protein